ncbi:MAG: hypothetical protein JRJ49_10085 [Deltaproteobacteria bacterium]|nr:hypothetical protein [Deltaproteobacteria bacterium]
MFVIRYIYWRRGSGIFNRRTVSILRGGYINAPTVKTTSQYPIIDTVTTTTSGASTTTTTAGNALNAPTVQKTTQGGGTIQYNASASYTGPAYKAEAFVNPNDTKFLSAALNEAFVLRGVRLVPPDKAEIDIYVTVDVFGTVRSRTEYLLYNQEKLLAKTALQVTAFDRKGNVVLPPTTSSFEAEYIEKYMLWMGPIKEVKNIRRSTPQLVDFKSIYNDTNIEPAQNKSVKSDKDIANSGQNNMNTLQSNPNPLGNNPVLEFPNEIADPNALIGHRFKVYGYDIEIIQYKANKGQSISTILSNISGFSEEVIYNKFINIFKKLNPNITGNIIAGQQIILPVLIN